MAWAHDIDRPLIVAATLTIALTFSMSGCGPGHPQASDRESTSSGPTSSDTLLQELTRLRPAERIRELSEYHNRQQLLGGGFFGLIPNLLEDPDIIPIPADPDGRLRAATFLSGKQAEFESALLAINPDYPIEFTHKPLSEFLTSVRIEATRVGADPAHLYLSLDMSAIRGFFDMIADGEITKEEALQLASLPSNQAMLQHRRDVGYVPAPLPTTDSLAEMIRMAGSTDPVDRLWCLTNSQNAFGYCDLVQNQDGYRRFLTELEEHSEDLVNEVLARVSRYSPQGTEFETTFAFTVGWAIRGWATPEMAGINAEQVKDDWSYLFGTMIEETYHRLQLQLFPTTTGRPASDFQDLVVIRTGNPRLDRLYELVAYLVAEGAANLARGEFAVDGLADNAAAGAELMARFVHVVVTQGDLESADALINEGLTGNGPLYALGWNLAYLIEQHDGPPAVAEYQRQGPVEFFLHGAELASTSGGPTIPPEVVVEVEELRNLLEGLRNDAAR